ncbi:MAG: response regulator [Myxococcota bacterium]|nr:response regulator [Myxococcota bacterium]
MVMATKVGARRASRGGKRVLVVDDHMDTVDVIAVLLRRLGHIVRTAYRGDEAIAAAAEFLPECAIVDLQMPGVSGFEVARYLRDRFGPVHLIALSGWEQRVRSEDGSFDRYLLKPVDGVTLSHLVEADAGVR